MWGKEKSGLGTGIYKIVNELGGVFGMVFLGTLLEARIVPNALRHMPSHFLPQELSLKVLPSLKGLESHAPEKVLPVQDLQGFHRPLIEAVQRGFEQAYSLAAVLAAIGIMVGLLLPRRIAARAGSRSASRGPGDRESKAQLDTTNPPSVQDW